MKLFRKFVLCANKSDIHEADWNRFYLFVKKSRMRKPLQYTEILDLLVDQGFCKNVAENIAEVYLHLYQFKII